MNALVNSRLRAFVSGALELAGTAIAGFCLTAFGYGFASGDSSFWLPACVVAYPLTVGALGELDIPWFRDLPRDRWNLAFVYALLLLPLLGGVLVAFLVQPYKGLMIGASTALAVVWYHYGPGLVNDLFGLEDEDDEEPEVAA